ncbi:MAG: gliding motility lipoprotein GldH [Bacteroidales bacterium]|nr:gliding motility lipoprotein GldH [Bacteroidales bacterium]MBK9356035.1 gliding motility lipoprotein GldH [Bacteroidales bacterium]
MKRILLSIFVLSILVSCQKGVTYKEFHKFDNYVWDRFEKVKFNIPVEEAGMKADIVFTIRHITQYPYDNLPVNVILTTPSGEERIVEKDIRLKNDKGEFTGSVAGDLWDFEEILWPGFQFNEAGNYTVEFENLIPKMGIPGLADIGICLRKSK